MYSFDLSTITEFNPAIIYGFEPESSRAELRGSELIKDIMYPKIGQYTDTFLAYRYAERYVLPFIRTQGIDKITPKLLLSWIKNIHKKIGYNLLKSSNIESGNYAQEELLRWHAGADMMDYVVAYMKGGYDTHQEWAACIQNQFKIRPQDSIAFLKILDKIKSLPNSILSKSQLRFIRDDRQDMNVLLWFEKFVPAYHENILSPEDKADIDKIVMVCIPFEKIEAAMQAYALKTLQVWRTCNHANIADVARFVGESFYELTNIHPFHNCNGRTATCMMNIMLRSFNLPSILLRFPGEEDLENSDYTLAFDVINSTRTPLCKLIEARIIAAQCQAFADVKLEKLIKLRIMFADILEEISLKYSKFDINGEFDKLQKKCLSKLPSNVCTLADSTELSILFILGLIKELGQSLTQFKQTLPCLSVMQPIISQEQRRVLCLELQRRTGLSGWKTNNNTGTLIVWLEHQCLEEATDACKLLEALSPNVMQVVLTKRQDNQIPVIKCTNININQLLSYTQPSSLELLEEKLEQPSTTS